MFLFAHGTPQSWGDKVAAEKTIYAFLRCRRAESQKKFELVPIQTGEALQG